MELAAKVTRECLEYSGDSYIDRYDSDGYSPSRDRYIAARTWSDSWEDRTKARAFVAAMARIREEPSPNATTWFCCPFLDPAEYPFLSPDHNDPPRQRHWLDEDEDEDEDDY